MHGHSVGLRHCLALYCLLPSAPATPDSADSFAYRFTTNYNEALSAKDNCSVKIKSDYLAGALYNGVAAVVACVTVAFGIAVAFFRHRLNENVFGRAGSFESIFDWSRVKSVIGRIESRERDPISVMTAG